MSYKKREINTGAIFHVLNRGVDKRKIFLDEKDYLRFVHNLFEFNDEGPITNSNYLFQKCSDDSPDDSTIVFARRYIDKKPRKLLVDILAFCLMPSHYHLLLKSRAKNGITKFVKKLNMGYARYFNEKNKRSGALFQGRYKSIAVTNEAYHIYLPYYIHLNPLDLITPEWRERSLKNYERALGFLNKYRWSSHLDYAGQKNFPSVTQRGLFLRLFSGPQEYKRGLENWLKDLDIKNVSSYTLE